MDHKSDDYGAKSDIFLVKMDFILVNESLDKTILFFTSVSRLAFWSPSRCQILLFYLFA